MSDIESLQSESSLSAPHSDNGQQAADTFTLFPFEYGLSSLNIDTFKEFLTWTTRNNISDIHLQGGNQIVVGRYGRLIPVTSFQVPDEQLSRLVDECFGPEIRALTKGAQPQDRPFQLNGNMGGRHGLNLGEGARFRCNFVQATAGKLDSTLECTLRVIPSEIPELTEMGIEQDLLEALLPSQGLGLIGGQTGSGKSTLLAAIYRFCATQFPDRKITTIEEPVEFIIARLGDILPATQLQIGKDVHSFAEGIRAALRRAPALIGVGEARDRDTIEAAILAGLVGHLCLSTLHINSPGEGIARILKAIPVEIREATASDLLSVLQYICVQRLLPTTDGKHCAIREYIVFDDDLRDELEGMPYTDWARHINGIIKNEQRRIIDKAWIMHQDGLIDRDALLTVMSRKQLRNMEAWHAEKNQLLA